LARINADTTRNTTVRRSQGTPSNWFQRIGSWFSFVNNRRLDQRFPVWPPRRTTAAVCGAAILIILMMLLVDRQFLALVRSGATDGNTFFETITMIGKSDWILYGTGCVILVFTIFTADRFAGKLHRLWHRLFLTAYFIFTSIAFSGLITNGLKIVFGRLRPPKVEGAVPWEAVPFTPGYDYASFPSGHSTTSGALAMALALLFPRFAWWFIAAGILIAASRSFIGVHFPSDVVAGLALGAGFTWIYARSFARKRLLFHYLPDGSLGLRGEGSGHVHEWTQLLSAGNRK
jgi:undecaprenyl-diphosphatase